VLSSLPEVLHVTSPAMMSCGLSVALGRLGWVLVSSSTAAPCMADQPNPIPASPSHAVACNGVGRVRGVRAGVAVRRAELLLGPWWHRGAPQRGRADRGAGSQWFPSCAHAMKAGRRLKGGNMKRTHVNPDSMLKNPAFSQAVMVEDAKKIVYIGEQTG
jgi:hypothetical protein